MSKTSQQIAEICGVSRGTVDRALNNRPGINPETKEKILQVAEQLGYRPHFLAQSLVKGSTRSIGAVLFDINNRLFPQLVNAIETRASELGYFLYLTLTNKDPEKEKDCLQHLVDRKVDGILLLSVNKGEAFEQFLGKLNVPVVTFGNLVSDGIPFVWVDDRAAIRDAVRHLAAQGYEEIIYLSPPMALAGKTNLYAVEQRYLGFEEAIAETPGLLTDIVLHKGYLEEIDALLRRGDKKKVILCTSDKYALKVLLHLKQKEIRIPQDVGLMGFDNIDTLAYISPALSTIAYSSDDVGTQAVDLLVDRIAGRDVPMRTTIPHRIVQGESI
ncbi:LacI family DNA-binding transcriptional regulator [Cohnella nanjingensis]|uniref:LacI family DNA-binding transcriptional regulator n=1 Tax=Cohnella nanjingensis TaxID=1387779 RepID=A0A7X0RWB5_9BACL|nr:LacI family DNA-binding transcriptional regulator [Cohnella nanjingensis]MBB6674867.1 LacI family DNA-binding transcriptional regulator [Cohnella nanjingensis]